MRREEGGGREAEEANEENVARTEEEAPSEIVRTQR